MGIVIEGDSGDVVVTEKLKDGSISWAENPVWLEVRNAAAKVVYSVSCVGSDLSFTSFESVGADCVPLHRRLASPSECKQYTEALLKQARLAVEEKVPVGG